MDALGSLFGMIYDFLQTQITIYGFTFTLWGVIIFSSVASIVGWFIHNLLFG